MRSVLLFILVVLWSSGACKSTSDIQDDGSVYYEIYDVSEPEDSLSDPPGDSPLPVEDVNPEVLDIGLDEAGIDYAETDIANEMDSCGVSEDIDCFPTFDPCEATTCEPVQVLDDLGDLDNLFANLEWNKDFPWCIVSDSYHLAGPIDIESVDLPGYTQCAECSVAFDVHPQAIGIECTDTSSVSETLGYCASVHIKDATFRLRAEIVPTIGFAGLTIPVVEFLPPCGGDCLPPNLSCPNDTCWEDPISYCLGCLGGLFSACACYGAEGSLTNGEECTYGEGCVITHGHCNGCGYCI